MSRGFNGAGLMALYNGGKCGWADCGQLVPEFMESDERRAKSPELRVVECTFPCGHVLYLAKKEEDCKRQGVWGAKFLSLAIETRGSGLGGYSVKVGGRGAQIATTAGQLAVWNEEAVNQRAGTGILVPTDGNMKTRLYPADGEAHDLSHYIAGLGYVMDYRIVGIPGSVETERHPLPELSTFLEPTREFLTLYRYYPHEKGTVETDADGKALTFVVKLGVSSPIPLLYPFDNYGLLLSDAEHPDADPRAGYLIVNLTTLKTNGLKKAIMIPSKRGALTLRSRDDGKKYYVLQYRAAALALHYPFVEEYDLPPEALQADHLDDEPQNNTPENMSLITAQANMSAPKTFYETGTTVLTDITVADLSVVGRVEVYPFPCGGGMRYDNLGRVLRRPWGEWSHGFTSNPRAGYEHYSAFDTSTWPWPVREWMIRNGVSPAKNTLAHRLMWILYNNRPIPPGTVINHDTSTWRGEGRDLRKDESGRPVIPSYPATLTAKTQQQNVLDMIAEKRRTIRPANRAG
mmetsp:Transcript_39602/g.126489  ORF Transcript_39602/g.126489 Transcript_39602/m.126489 type:complete len:518 (-) Transcript_39602:249-1802(-)